MGTWSLPTDENKARRLSKLMGSALSAGEAFKRLPGLLGDDDLFDEIEDVEGSDVGRDVRYLVYARLAELIDGFDDGRVDVRDGWQPGALAICRRLAGMA